MSEVIGKTKVTYKGTDYICDNFQKVWERLNKLGYAISESNKSNLIRILFVCGAYKVDDNLEMEVVWDE